MRTKSLERGAPRIAVASIIQETNTFCPRFSTLEDFEAHGLYVGTQAADFVRGTNTEFAGALDELVQHGAEPVPIMRAWAMSGGLLTRNALESLRCLLVDTLSAAGSLNGMVLSLHGALAAVEVPAADAVLTEAARAVLGSNAPIIVTHDLHANVTKRILASASALIGYRTYPHVDFAQTGRKAAWLVLRELHGAPPARTVVAKRAMIVPAEAQALADPPMKRLRALADEVIGGDVLDVSLFPVQPWLDVPDLGFGVTVTSTGDADMAGSLADRIAEAAWIDRNNFEVVLYDVGEVIRNIPRESQSSSVLLVQSADSPTAGATADNPQVIAALLEYGRGLRSLATVVDAPAVAACHDVGTGGHVETLLGATLDTRWASPLQVTGRVLKNGDSSVILTGEALTGQPVNMGRWSTLDMGTGLIVLITERPAPTFDPACYRHVGLEPTQANAIVVRSATMFRCGFDDISSAEYVLDLPGASTPRLRYLEYHHVPRPLFPLDK